MGVQVREVEDNLLVDNIRSQFTTLKGQGINDDLIIIDNKIYEIRGQKVMLDFDLAEMYEIETKYLKQMVRRKCRAIS